MPRDETPRGAGWLSDLRYIQRHLGPTLALGARRVAVELAHVRPYYRARHNVLIVAVLLPLYTLALIGIAATWRHPLTHLLLALIAAHLLFVAVTLADYDGRFLLYILGPLAALAAAGVGRLSGVAARRGLGRRPAVLTAPGGARASEVPAGSNGGRDAPRRRIMRPRGPPDGPPVRARVGAQVGSRACGVAARSSWDRDDSGACRSQVVRPGCDEGRRPVRG